MEIITLDFSGCKYIGEIHKVLKESFGLPDYYGENWDALWDCLHGYYRHDPTTVKIYGLTSLYEEFDYEVKKMIEVFDDVHADTPNIEFEYIS